MTHCECGEELTLEMEKDAGICTECQKVESELPDMAKSFLASSNHRDQQSYLHGYAKGALYGVANYGVDPARMNREYLALARYAKKFLSDKEGSEA